LSSPGVSSDKLLAGVEEKEGAVESACGVRGEDSLEEKVESEGDEILPNPIVLRDLERVVGYDDGCVTNLGWECDRWRELEDEK